MWVIISRSLRKTGKKSRLSKVQVFRGSVKIGLRSGFDAVSMFAVIIFVQINLQDLVLGIAPGDFGSEDDFLDFS